MALYRFLFAPVLLAVAVLGGAPSRIVSPPPAAGPPGAAAFAPVSAPAAAARPAPVHAH
jgi:hypothetical protein